MPDWRVSAFDEERLGPDDHAAKGLHADSLNWLDKAITRGWLGRPYSSRLSDYPQFDASQGNPKFAMLQRRLDATIERERAETLRSSK